KFHNFAIPVDQAREKRISSATATFVQEREVLHRLAQQPSWSSGHLVGTERDQLHLLTQRLQLFGRHFLHVQQASLPHIQKIVDMADPKLLLKKGYSITQVRGKALQHAEQVQEGDLIETLLFDGKITSTVTTKS